MTFARSSRHPGRPRRWIVAAITAAASLLLMACGADDTEDQSGEGAASAAATSEEATDGTDSGDGFPRVVSTDLGDVTIEARPERIVAASTNAAEIALALVGPERVSAVPEFNLGERNSPYAAEAQAVGATVPGIANDPEQLLAMEPDLVLITLAHDPEVEALELLQEAGIPTVALGRHPIDIDDVLEQVETIGQALGAEEEAAAHIQDIEQRVAAVEDAVADAQTTPRVAFVTMWTDSGPYVSGPGTLNDVLLRLAGAENAMEAAGFSESGYLDPEQLVAAAPTHIVTRDGEGIGLEVAGGFFDDPGVADVPAIADDRILVLPNGDFAASTAGIDGLEAMASWLHDPDATTEAR